MLDKFISQLRDNPRLRWGVALIIGIFWLYGVLVLRETLQAEEQQLRVATNATARLRAQLAQPEWASRVIAAKTMSVQLEGKLWQAPTSGLAQAAFQDWLNSTMSIAGATHTQITVTVIDELTANTSNQQHDPGSTTPSDLWKIKAVLGFDYSVPVLLEFLNRIENNEHQIIVESLSVRKEPAPHVEMELYGYFQKQAAPAKTNDKLLTP
jgi:hypothetical protein